MLLCCGSFNLSFLKKPIYAGERILEREFPHVITLRGRDLLAIQLFLIAKRQC